MKCFRNNNDVFQDVVTTTGTLSTSTFNIMDNTLAWKFTAVNDGNNIDLIAIFIFSQTIHQSDWARMWLHVRYC